MGTRKYVSSSAVLADESTSVATLGSFGSASWVAEQFSVERGESMSPPPELTGEVSTNEDDGDVTDRHVCTECTRTFDSSARLQAHFERVHASLERGFKCPHCGKAFTRRSEMGRHVGVRLFFSCLLVLSDVMF